MLSVLVWLAMQGHRQTPELCQEYGEGHGIVLWSNCSPKPAEHVMEIKTIREDHGTAKGLGGLGGSPHCDNPDDVLEVPNQCHENACTSMYIAPHCVKVTRELWIDGQRWGVVKGLD